MARNTRNRERKALFFRAARTAPQVQAFATFEASPTCVGLRPTCVGLRPTCVGLRSPKPRRYNIVEAAPGNLASPRCISQEHPEFWVIRLVSYAMLGNSVAGGVLGPAAQGAGFYFPKIGGGHSPGSRQNQGENQITTYIRQANWQSVKHRLPVGKGISPMGRLDVYLDPPEHNNPHCLCSSPHWEEQLRRPDDGHVNKAGTALGRCSLKGKKPAPW